MILSLSPSSSTSLLSSLSRGNGVLCQ